MLIYRRTLISTVLISNNAIWYFCSLRRRISSHITCNVAFISYKLRKRRPQKELWSSWFQELLLAQARQKKLAHQKIQYMNHPNYLQYSAQVENAHYAISNRVRFYYRRIVHKLPKLYGLLNFECTIYLWI